MKTLLALLSLSLLMSCASTRPQLWQDEYGIKHREHVTPGEVSMVEIVEYAEIPVGCKQLRTIYIDGHYKKDWELKERAAKMFATHVTKEYVNNVSDTLGVAFDCTNYRATARSIQRDKLYLKRKLMQEKERRRINRGESYKLTPIKPEAKNTKAGELPVYNYEG